MLGNLIRFEWKFYNRKVSFYVMLLSFFAIGILLGTSTAIGFPNIKNNSPYAINFIAGLFSLASLFPIVITASQSLLREKDNQFEDILYATPIIVVDYLISRFFLVFGIVTLSFILFILGYMLGHLIEIEDSEMWGKYNGYYYLHTFLVMVIPNIFLSSVIISCTAWFSKNKMHIYLSGLGIYVLYMVTAIFTNSPIFAGVSPTSEATQQLAAKLDPFGLSAFFEQTRYWGALERNTKVLQLSGNLLFNRILVLVAAMTILLIAYKFFSFKVVHSQKKREKVKNTIFIKNFSFKKVNTETEGISYFISTIISFLKIDLKSTIKSISFTILIVITLFALGMELYGTVEGGIRLPQYFATTSLMSNTILSTLPFLLILAMLFYGNELVWKSKSVNFSNIECATPFSIVAKFISKITALIFITFILITTSIALAVVFQKGFDYPIIDWGIYFLLFYFIGLPAILCGAVIVSIHYIVNNKYIAMVIAALFLVLTNTSIGMAIGFSNPLVRFANFIPGAISDMNGFGYLTNVFAIKMTYSLSFALLIGQLAIILQKNSIFKLKFKQLLFIPLPLLLFLVTSFYLNTKSNIISETDQLNWQQQYEEKYSLYKSLPQPSITEVKTAIDLFPEQNSYRVKGTYVLVNKTSVDISEIIIKTYNQVKRNAITSSELTLIQEDNEFGHSLFKTKAPMQPNDSLSISYEFEYKIEPLNGHNPFNAIVDNGAFIRISNYFPSIGYNFENEIEDNIERKKRGMPIATTLTKVDAPLANPYNYEFINFDVYISTSSSQTAISVGELICSSFKNKRNYFHYSAKNIPFRFAVASANYALKKANYNEIDIEVLYDLNHDQNINHLICSIKKSLQYCEKNFGRYPYKSIRFAEISNFTRGFAATSYPATVFINENQFHLNLNSDEGQDIINELTGHELSHQWWGNALLNPDYREGRGVLTETLAQYTQLMIYKNEHGKVKMEEMVDYYNDQYASGKAFTGEEPLYTSNPNNSNVIYNKGMVKMYELYLLIGEKNINLALKNLLSKYKYPYQPATTLDLIYELKLVTDKVNHKRIDELFKE